MNEDPDRKWIITWNDYLNDIKFFFRWLCNNKKKTGDEYNENGDMTMTTTLSDWETPPFGTLILKSL